MHSFQKHLSHICIALAALMVCLSSSQAWAVHGELKLEKPKPDIARTPPMGWNSWNHYGCEIDEAKIRAAADSLVSSGMRDVGYRYVIVDDCWQTGRAHDGSIIADPKKFPSGIKALADYVHAKGLKFGIYSDAGLQTCGGRPGSRGHEFQDAQTYADWGVDFLKYDWCNTGIDNPEAGYTVMAIALRATGRDIVFSICEWGSNKPWQWALPIGHMWRTTSDIHDSWDKNDGYQRSVLDILDSQVGLGAYAGPNQWNDPDMLEVGNGRMTPTEYRSHFSLWSMLAAPLIAGNDLGAMSADTLSILTNKDVVAVDQDPLGIEAHRASKQGDSEVWVRPLSGGGRAVLLLNRSSSPQTIGFDWSALQYPDGLTVDIRDLWSKGVQRRISRTYQATVAAHGVIMLRLSPTL